jgi:Flp pilus assembly protein CpaB
MQYAQRILSTRGGTIAVSILAAVLAAVILVAYLHRYRESVRAAGTPVTVLVAKGVIEKGSSGDVVANQELYVQREFTKSEVSEGAITDPEALKGHVAGADIFPGEQLTTAKFSGSDTGSLANRITENQRVVTVPVDGAHGMIGQVQAGDHIDVYAGFNVRRLTADGRPEPGVAERAVLRLITEDVLVLDVPQSGSGGIGGNKAKLTLRVSDEDAAKIAFTADNGIIWTVLRPRANAAPASPAIVSVETVLFGVPSVDVIRSLGAKQ